MVVLRGVFIAAVTRVGDGVFVETQVRKALEILLKRRLAAYARLLDTHKRETSSSQGMLATRSGVLSKFEQAYQAYLRQVLRDYIEALVLFDGFESPDDAWEVFEAHTEAAVEQMVKRIPGIGPPERKRLSNQVARAQAEIRASFAAAAEQQQKAMQQAEREELNESEIDDRLPLGRRAAFDRDLALLVADAKRQSAPCALIMMDIDHFKRVNDMHGHPVGDEVLLGVAQRLVDRVGHRGKAYRYGGEEFAVLLPGYSAEEAFGLAERIRKDIERESVSSRKLSISASFGTVSVPEEASNPAQLLERADSALYEAKEGGRNQVRIGNASK
ncbi:MAG: diguanylate cyclase [Chitinivibrionales bacterium]|nr:diguanylate cyclase [Chitinivibrionales bacterium]